MNHNYKDLLIYLVTILSLQILAFLIDRSSGTAFLTALVLVLGYELYRNAVNPKEAITLITTFLISGIAFATLSKYLVYERLCNVSNSLSGSELSLMSSKETCLSIPEIWVKVIASNPVETWYFWIATLGTSLLALKAYQEYSDRIE